MLFLAPYDVPEKKAKKAAKGTRSGLRRKGASVVMSKDETHSSPDDEEEEEEEEDSRPKAGRKKRAASKRLEAKAPKRGKGSPADNSAWDVDSSPERPSRAKPRAKSPARDSSPLSSSEGSLDPKERASVSPPPTYSPSAKGDDEEVPQRASSDQGKTLEIVRAAPQDDSWTAGYMGKKAHTEVDGAGRVQFDPQPDSIPETYTAPESGKRPFPKASLRAATAQTAEVSRLKQKLERVEEELGRVKKQLENIQGM
nr:podocalyxin-like protein 2 [Aegilops tauschii subsp. strangulata]